MKRRRPEHVVEQPSQPQLEAILVLFAPEGLQVLLEPKDLSAVSDADEESAAVSVHETVPEPGHFTPQPNESIMCRLDYLMTKLGDPSIQVLNVLPTEFYRGTENPFGNKRVGHIPGSLNLPIEHFLTSDDRHLFKPASELRAILAAVGLSPTNEIIVHCQAGIRTTVGFFVLALLGWDRVRAYDAAMAEWANRDDTPLVVEKAEQQQIVGK